MKVQRPLLFPVYARRLALEYQNERDAKTRRLHRAVESTRALPIAERPLPGSGCTKPATAQRVPFFSRTIFTLSKGASVKVPLHLK